MDAGHQARRRRLAPSCRSAAFSASRLASSALGVGLDRSRCPSCLARGDGVERPRRAAPLARSTQASTSCAVGASRREGRIVGRPRQHRVHARRAAGRSRRRAHDSRRIRRRGASRRASRLAVASTARLNWSSIQVQASPWLRTKPCATASAWRSPSAVDAARPRRAAAARWRSPAPSDSGSSRLPDACRARCGGRSSASRASSTISELFDCSAVSQMTWRVGSGCAAPRPCPAWARRRSGPSGVSMRSPSASAASIRRAKARQREGIGQQRRRAGRGARAPARAGAAAPARLVLPARSTSGSSQRWVAAVGLDLDLGQQHLALAAERCQIGDTRALSVWSLAANQRRFGR